MKSLDNVIKYWGKNLDDCRNLMCGEEVFFSRLLEIAKKSRRILEVGIGKGRMVNILRDYGVKGDFYGLDITDNVKHADAHGVIGDCRILPFKDCSFDLVYSLGVIEHFPETKLAVINHAKAVKKGGHVLVTLPARGIFTPLRYSAYILRDFRKGTFAETRGRNINLEEIKGYFQDAGLTIVDCGYFGIFGVNRKVKTILNNFRFIRKAQNKLGAYLFIMGEKI